MKNIYEDIIIYNNSVGKLIQDFDIELKIPIFRFYPAGYGPYYPAHLEIVHNIEDNVKLADTEHCKEYAIKEFKRYRRFKDLIFISDKYQIIIDADDKYYPLINYNYIFRSFDNLKLAVLGMIIYDCVGNEDRYVSKYIYKLLDMKQE